MPYIIKKALACRRWDLIVNNIVIHSEGSKSELSDVVSRLVTKGLLVES
jgi:hypothetical protein